MKKGSGGSYALPLPRPASVDTLFGGESAAEALARIGWGPGCSAMVFTLGQWSCRGLAEAVIARNAGPWELRLATWNLAEPDLDVVVGWCRRGVSTLVEIVLDRSMPRRNASHRRSFSSVLSARESGLVDYRLTEVHAKWTLLRCSSMAVTVMATANRGGHRCRCRSAHHHGVAEPSAAPCTPMPTLTVHGGISIPTTTPRPARQPTRQLLPRCHRQPRHSCRPGSGRGCGSSRRRLLPDDGR